MEEHNSEKVAIINISYFFIGIILIILISGTFKIDQDIANKSEGYFVNKNIQEANEAGRLGYIKFEINDYAEYFGLKWTWKHGMDRMRIIRSCPEDFDHFCNTVLYYFPQNDT